MSMSIEASSSVSPLTSFPPPERARTAPEPDTTQPGASPASVAQRGDTVSLRHRAETAEREAVRQVATEEIRDADVAVEVAEHTREQIRFDAQLGLRAHDVSRASASELLLG